MERQEDRKEKVMEGATGRGGETKKKKKKEYF